MEKLKKNFEKIADGWNSIFGQFKSLKFDLSKNIPSIDLTLEEMNEREITIFEFLCSFEYPKDASKHLLIQSAKKILESHIETTLQQIGALEAHFKSIAANGGINTFDSNNLAVTCTNGQSISIKNELEAINGSTETMLSQFSLFVSFGKVKFTGDLSRKTKQLQELHLQYEQEINAFQTEFKELSRKIVLSEDLKKKQENYVEAAEKNKTDIDNIQKESINNQAEIKAKVGTINETSVQAETLKKRVVDFQSKFDSFDKQLNSRVESLQKTENDMQLFLEKNATRETQIQELTTKADTLIKGATVVGLANSFSESATEFKAERNKSIRAFYVSIFVLFACTVPLAVYVFSNLSITELPKLEFTGLVTRAILLLPGIWLTKFNSRRFHLYSELHRQYSHKATIAKAIEGFKKESPEYKEQISAAAFMELHTQPELDFERRKKSGDLPINPPMKDLMNTIGAKLFLTKK